MEEDKDAETRQEDTFLTEKQVTELKERLESISKQLMTMEWDKEHNQLNAGVEEKYAKLKAEHDAIVKKMSGSGESKQP